jgi:hypothetical protein
MTESCETIASATSLTRTRRLSDTQGVDRVDETSMILLLSEAFGIYEFQVLAAYQRSQRVFLYIRMMRAVDVTHLVNFDF